MNLQSPSQSDWEDMSKMYWRWFYSIPRTNDHPCVDTTSKHLSKGQNDPNLFFLPGACREDNKRRATIDAKGKRIFMPILVVSFTEPERPNTDLIKAAREDINGMTFTECDTSDGIIVQDERRVAVPELFEVDIEAPTYFTNTKAGKKQKASSDGYWLLTEPLKEGFHTIITRGQTKEDDQFYGSVTYHLEVK
jgi:hypothetical protein